MTRTDTWPLTGMHWKTRARFLSPGDRVGRVPWPSLPTGATREARIVDLPFSDRDKTIVRGTDRRIPARPISMPFDAR